VPFNSPLADKPLPLSPTFFFVQVEAGDTMDITAAYSANAGTDMGSGGLLANFTIRRLTT
jgi:hypothetical protein